MWKDLGVLYFICWLKFGDLTFKSIDFYYDGALDLKSEDRLYYNLGLDSVMCKLMKCHIHCHGIERANCQPIMKLTTKAISGNSNVCNSLGDKLIEMSHQT